MSVRYKDEDGNIHIIPTGANYWTGTWDEYQSAKANIANGTYINITDKDSGVVEQTLSDSFNAVSGKAVKAVTDDIEETLSSVPRTVDTLATAADAVRDADTLGGHAVSYYATKSSVDTVNDSLNNKTNHLVGAQDYATIESALSYLTSKMSVGTNYSITFTRSVKYVGYLLTYQTSATPNYAMGIITSYNGRTFKCSCLNGTWTIKELIDIDNLNSVPKIKSDTVSGTTSTSGNILVKSGVYVKILGVIPTDIGANCIFTPMYYSGNTYLKVRNNEEAIRASVSVSATYFYID